MNLEGVSTLDLIFGAVLLISALIGLWRGFVFEVLSLAGWVIAYLAAQFFAPEVAPNLRLGAPGSALNFAVAFAVVFLLALVLWGLLARLVRLLIRATPLSAFDRLLGCAFGALRGLALLLAVATLVLLTPMRDGAAWRQSRIAQGLHAMLQALTPMLPAEVAQHLPA